MPSIPYQSKAGFSSIDGVLVDQTGLATVNFNTRVLLLDWAFPDNVNVNGLTSLAKTVVTHNHATEPSLTVAQLGAAAAIKSEGPLVGTSYFMPNILDSLGGGAGFREKSSAPGMWFEELAAAKGAMFVLYGGNFTLQRRSTSFGDWESNPFNVNINAPTGSFSINNSGVVSVGKYILANTLGSADGAFREKGAAPGFWLEQAGAGLGALVVLNSGVLQVQRRATGFGLYQAQVCRFELATLDAYFGNNVTATRLVSTQALGTSPLLVTSTTVNTNLNADLLDGLHAAAFARTADVVLSMRYSWTVTS